MFKWRYNEDSSKTKTHVDISRPHLHCAVFLRHYVLFSSCKNKFKTAPLIKLVTLCFLPCSRCRLPPLKIPSFHTLRTDEDPRLNSSLLPSLILWSHLFVTSWLLWSCNRTPKNQGTVGSSLSVLLQRKKPLELRFKVKLDLGEAEARKEGQGCSPAAVTENQT